MFNHEMNMKRTSFLALLILWGVAAPSQGGVIVTIQDLTITQGQSGFVDVTISSDSGDLLNNYGFQFLITGGTTSSLSFVDPQPRAYLSDSSYVFSGNSSAVLVPADIGNVATTTTTNDTYNGSDSLFTGTNVTLGATQQLLVRLNVQASGVPPNPNDVFTISVNPAATAFLDFNFNPASFTSTSGSVTVAVVPEPSSLALAIIGLGFPMIVFLRRYRSLSPNP